MSYNGNSNDFPLNVRTTPISGDLYNVYEEIGTPPSPPTIGFLLLEDGAALLMEDGSNLLLE